MTRPLLTLALLGAVALSPTAGSAQIAQQGNTAAVQRAIDDLWARAVDGIRKGDVAALVAMYADSAMVVDPGMPTEVGKAQIESGLKQFFATTKVLEVTHQQTALEVSGDVAVENGVFTETFQETGKPPQKLTSRYMFVFKNVGGKWLVLRDVAIPMPAASPAR